MSIIYLTSASGSPGVSTLAAALAINLPRPTLLLEADTSRASQVMPGLFNARYSHQDMGLTEANVASVRGQLTAQFLLQQTIRGGAEQGRYVIPGFNDLRGGQNASPAFWATLTRALYGLPQAAGVPELDIVVDGGRFRAGDPRDALLAAADMILVVTGNTIPDLASAHAALPHLTHAVQSQGKQDDIRIVVVPGPHKSPYGTKEVEDTLQRHVVASFPWDPKAAARFSHGTTNYARKGPFQKQILRLIETLEKELAERRYTPQKGLIHER